MWWLKDCLSRWPSIFMRGSLSHSLKCYVYGPGLKTLAESYEISESACSSYDNKEYLLKDISYKKKINWNNLIGSCKWSKQIERELFNKKEWTIILVWNIFSPDYLNIFRALLETFFKF